MIIDDTDTNPGAADTEIVPANEEVTELESETDELDEGAEGPTDEELEEIEEDGKKAKVPAWLKPKLMMQADYTRKTQEVAEQRKAHEAQVQDFQQKQQAFQAEAQDYAKLIALDTAIKQYEAQIGQLRQQGQHDAAQRHWMDLMEMRNAAGQLSHGLQQKQQARQAETEREYANRIRERDTKLPSMISGFTPALLSKINDHAKADGYTAEEVQSIADPRFLKTLNDARLWNEHQAKAKAAAKAAKVAEEPEAKPTPTVGARKATTNRLDDNMPIDKWMALRNKQVAARGG